MSSSELTSPPLISASHVGSRLSGFNRALGSLSTPTVRSASTALSLSSDGSDEGQVEGQVGDGDVQFAAVTAFNEITQQTGGSQWEHCAETRAK